MIKRIYRGQVGWRHCVALVICNRCAAVGCVEEKIIEARISNLKKSPNSAKCTEILPFGAKNVSTDLV
jgi:hypothetical protein